MCLKVSVMLTMLILVLGFPSFGNETLTNVAMGKPCYASSVYDTPFGPANLCDGNQKSIWASVESVIEGEDWVYIDLGQQYTIRKLTIHWYDMYKAHKYNIAVSDDAKNWNVVFSETNSNGEFEHYDSSMNARYIGLLFTDKSKDAVAIREIEVFARASGNDAWIFKEDSALATAFTECVSTSDGSVLISGYKELTQTPHTAETKYTGYVAKLDPMGRKLWHNELKVGEGHVKVHFAVESTPETTFAYVSDNRTTGVFYAIDDTGNKTILNEISVPGYYAQYLKTSQNTLLFIHSNYDVGGCVLYHVDLQGKILFKKEFGTSMPSSITEGVNGDYAIALFTSLIVIDHDGIEKYRANVVGTIRDVTPLFDGTFGFIATNRYGKIYTDGNYLWYKSQNLQALKEVGTELHLTGYTLKPDSSGGGLEYYYINSLSYDYETNKFKSYPTNYHFDYYTNDYEFYNFDVAEDSKGNHVYLWNFYHKLYDDIIYTLRTGDKIIYQTPFKHKLESIKYLENDQVLACGTELGKAFVFKKH